MLTVMSHQYNRLSLNKRPFSFLGNEAQIRKDFGSNSKKPRLDITLTPSCSTKHPLDESQFNTTSADPYDDVWEEELSEDIVEECFLLATQASQAAPEEVNETTVCKSKSTTGRWDTKNFNGICPALFLQEPRGNNSSRTGNDQPKSSMKQTADVNASKFKVPAAFQNSKISPPAQKFQPKKPSNLYAVTDKGPVLNQVNPVIESDSKLPSKVQSSTDANDKLSFSVPDAVNSFKKENEELKESLLSKEGEVSLLRSQIKKLQMQLETQLQESVQESKAQAKKFTDKIETYKKELEITKTELQFKIIEATAGANHSKMIESSSKLKLVEPESAVVDTPSFTEHLLSKSSPEKLQRNLELFSAMEDTDSSERHQFTHQLQQLPHISEGAKLGLALSESLQELPIPEVDWLHCIRQTEKFRSTAETAREINMKIVALQNHCFTIHSCIAQIIKLVAMTTLSSSQSAHLISQVVLVCRNVLCRQIHILRLLQQVQSSPEWHELDEKVAMLVGTIAAPEDADPFTARSWYRGEQGIESRRAFGLLEALCASSQLAADLVSGSSGLNDTSHIISSTEQLNTSSSESVVQRAERLVTTMKEGPNSVDSSSTDIDSESIRSSGDVIIVEPQSDSSSKKEEHPKGVDTELHLLLKQIPAIPKISSPDRIPIHFSDYMSDQHGFLQLCLEIASQISLQRRTHSFVGVLTCMMRMLRAVALKSSFTKRGLQIVKEIIRDVVFSCPQADVVAATIALLANTSQHISLMDNLCHGSISSTLVDRHLSEVVYFTRDSCVLQVLLRLVPTNCTSLAFRTSLCSNLVAWLAGLIFQQKQEAVWMRATGPVRECSCKAKLIHVLVTALYESFNDFQDLHAQGQNSAVAVHLGRHLCMGVRLLHALMQQDELIGSYLDGVEGQYQLFLTGLRDSEELLLMTDTEMNCLKELLELEVVTSDGVIAVPLGEEDISTNTKHSVVWEDGEDSDMLWKKMECVLQWDMKIKSSKH